MSGDSRLTGELAKRANKLLPAVANLFKKNNIPFCLDGGTLLGIIRENRLLPWDNDLDFFVRGVDAPKIASLKWKLLLLGCRLRKKKALDTYGPMKKGAPRIYKIQSLRKYNGQRVMIDLIFKYVDEENYHWVVGVKPPVHKKISRHYYDQFGEVNYKGVNYPVPFQVEKYLESRYGNWKVQKKDWDFKKDDGAINNK